MCKLRGHNKLFSRTGNENSTSPISLTCSFGCRMSGHQEICLSYLPYFMLSKNSCVLKISHIHCSRYMWWNHFESKNLLSCYFVDTMSSIGHWIQSFFC